MQRQLYTTEEQKERNMKETNYYVIDVKLFNDMTNLGYVYVIKIKDREEIIQLESKIKKDE